MGYNLTLSSRLAGNVSSNLSLGISGTSGIRWGYNGAAPDRVAASFSSPSIRQSLLDENRGGFGRAQIGFFESLYFTAAIRGERSPRYGKLHGIDWSPTYGVTYTTSYQDLTLKLLASYGRATRPPTRGQRETQLASFFGSYEPGQWTQQFSNSSLRPEYASGPQGGFELYFENRATFTVNRYHQKVDDLIQSVIVDSILVTAICCGDYQLYMPQSRNVNAATLRQKGWEMTGSLNMGPVTFKGTHSIVDAKLEDAATNVLGQLPIGVPLIGVAERASNVTINYAYGNTSIVLIVNYIGQMMADGVQGPRSQVLTWERAYSRIKTYVDHAQIPRLPNYMEPGYVKSDLAVIRRLTPALSLTVNVENLGNSAHSDLVWLSPSLGRVSTFGLSLRLP